MNGQTHDPVHGARYSFQPDGDDLIVDTWLESGGKLPPHLHPYQEERWSVVDGEITFRLGNDKRLLRPEDGEVVVRPGTKHAVIGSSGREAHLRCRVVPARGLQSFLEDSAAAAREGLFMRGGIPKSVRGARWAARFMKQHRDDVVMTFPPRFVQSALIGLLGR